ncbi:ABC-type antimicrobial peptide transport system permease subunit [Chitinophaga dinghuensis]|uniref:ABC-type antimicrobial peptide transport system permease subunit n=1 Tax=Chitinophaga dinghuensis TaxID=1539050 RepID=A0A327VNI4_9BACT|nr:ABC transporter permease [Chitinophaga dinghuensis]RAJ76653.1 ABC-type antimicrobial peptide transport system permease subunit [Chitinophaga dinghuensis]
MFKSYIKVACRNLSKNKLYTAINIIGLAFGITIFLLIAHWIIDEWSYDKQFKNYKKIAQVWQNVSNNGTIGTGNNQPFPLGATLRKDYGHDFRYVAMSTWNQTHVLSPGNNALSRTGIYCEPDLTKILTLQMVQGTDRLSDPNTILLSQSLAHACFGDENPINKTLTIDNKQAVVVAGIYQDLPYNSTFVGIDYMMPWEQYARNDGLYQDSNPWKANSYRAFVQVADQVDMKIVSEKIKDVKMKNIREDELILHPQLFLHPMSRWHLYSEFNNGVNTGGQIRYLWLLGMGGLFVLLLACINFMNLSTARSEKRAKEVGVRKVVGAQRNQLIYQFFGESFIVVFIALLISILLMYLLLPFFNQISDKRLVLFWTSPLFWIVALAFCIITGLIAGSYPAFYLSSFRPVSVLKGAMRAGKSAAIPRKVLVIVQFTVSVTLIIVTTIVFRQIQFAQNRPIGYDRNGLIMVPMYTHNIHQHFDAVRTELLETGAIKDMAESWSPVTSVWSTNSGFNWVGKDPGLAIDFPNDGVSYDYGHTLGWEFLAGRDFSRSFATDSAAFVINETAAKFMGIKDPLGKTVTWDGIPYSIIGIIKDVVAESPYEPVRPTFFHLSSDPGTQMIVKINPAVSTREALEKVADIFKKYNPNAPFDYHFVDQEYARKFGEEQRFAKLAGIFSILAIFISCIGLFGITSYMAEKRTKEIGLRKLLGASLFSLWRLLSTDLLMLVLISFIIAFPVAYYSMTIWLQHYQYHTPIAWWIFPLAAGGTLFIAILTVSYQTIRATRMNPVKSLKSE